MLALAEDLPLEILESNHHDCHVVEGLPVEGIFQNTFHCKAALLVDVLCQLLILIVDSYTVPDTGRDIFVGQLIKDAITAKDNEVMVLRNFKGVDIRLANDDSGLSTPKFELCFWVSEGARD